MQHIILKLRLGARWLGIAVLILSIFYYSRHAASYIDDLLFFGWGYVEWGAFFGSLILYIFGVAISCFIWQLLLYEHNLKPGFLRLMIIFFIAQFGKYLPGNFGHHVGRVYMAKVAGIPVAATIHTMVIEALFGVGIGAALALLSLWLVLDVNTWDKAVALPPYVLIFLALVTLLLPWAAVRGLNVFLPRLANKISGGGPIVEPRFRIALAVAGLFLVCFFIIGLVLKLHAVWLFGVARVSVLEFAALFAVAWVAGYVVPGAPAGLGIREALMLMLFSPLLGPEVAVGLSVSLRVTTTLGDAFAFILGIMLRAMIDKAT